MARRNTKAGGFFLMAAIVIGFAIGIWHGTPVLGGLVGTVAGALLALLVWLVDRVR